jgi:hypothetical protein
VLKNGVTFCVLCAGEKITGRLYSKYFETSNGNTNGTFALMLERLLASNNFKNQQAMYFRQPAKIGNI